MKSFPQESDGDFIVTFGYHRFWRNNSFSKCRLDCIGIGWKHLRDFVATVRNLEVP